MNKDTTQTLAAVRKALEQHLEQVQDTAHEEYLAGLRTAIALTETYREMDK